MEKKITYLDPSELKIHPALKALGQAEEWQDGESSFKALQKSIFERGVDVPLIVDDQNRVMDGRVRLLCARKARLAQVPCIVRSEEEVHTVILESLVLRKHYPTKGAMVFELWPVIEPAYQEARNRYRASFQNRAKTSQSSMIGVTDSIGDGGSFEQFCKARGFSKDLADQAKTIWGLFEKHAERRNLLNKKTREITENVTFEEYYAPQIRRGEVGLGAVVAGIEGSLRHKENPKQHVDPPDQLFLDGFKTLCFRVSRVDVKQRAAAVSEILEGLDDEGEVDRIIELGREMEALGKKRKRELQQLQAEEAA